VVAILAGPGTGAFAQSTDSLLNKLVSKGILTADEAAELKKESAGDFTKAYQSKSGLPDWVTSLKIGGEFRGRYEGFYVDNPAFVDRHRFRYRLRLGTTAVIKDDFEVGVRLMSGEPSGNFGGDPVSGNSTLQDNGSRKFVYVDLAYAKWSPLHTPEWNGAFTIGKMEIPIVASDMIFDDEYTPEGAAAQFSWKASSSQTLKLNGGAFVLDELGASSHDAYMFAGQLRWDAVWTKQISSALGFTALSIMRDESLVNGNVPNGNRGNTRNAAGAPAFGFNPLNVDASLTYTLEHFPCYAGPFPVKAGGEYMVNPAADDDRNTAWFLGVQLGKAGKKHQWEVSYRWKTIESDAWYEEVMDGDFGAYYEQQLPNAGFTGTGAGFGSGTNIRGHVFRAAYSPNDSLTLLFAYYLTKLIDESPAGSNSRAGRLQASALWKF
jgi:hypothetical protein